MAIWLLSLRFVAIIDILLLLLLFLLLYLLLSFLLLLLFEYYYYYISWNVCKTVQSFKYLLKNIYLFAFLKSS